MPMKQGFVHQVFSQLVEEDGDRLAIEDSGGTRVTFGQLEESANRLACYLLSEVGSGSIMAIVAEDTVTVITAILASLKAGCTFVPLDPRLPSKRLEMLMAQVAPAIRLHSLETVNWNHVGPTRPQITSAPDDMCYIYFTSGSTGTPKGIAGRLKAIDHFVRWEIETLGLREGIRVSQFTNPSFDAYLRDAFVPLCAGGTVCVPPDFGNALDGPQLVKWIDDSRINLIHCVPSLFRALIHEDLHPEHFPFLQHILLSGEPLLPADVKRWMSIFGERIRLVNLYGPTETTMIKFFHFVTAADQDRRAIPIGKPIAGTKAIVVDAQGKACPMGTVGEIYIRTPYRSLGYFKQPELTSEVFIPNPFSNKPDDIVYKTGDLARVLEDGSFEFMGRKDRQVKIRGIRVELSEIEDLLLGHEAVKDVVVVDREDTSGNKYLCAYVVMSGEVTRGALRDYLSEHVPGYLVPSAFVTLEALPRTPTGKVDRSALPAVGQEGKETRAFIAPETETEQTLADIWAQVLGVEHIGLDDSFFELGGHSLLATQVVSRIRLVFHLEISLRTMFESPTLGGMAAKIDQARAPSDAKAEKIAGLLTITARRRDNGALPLSFGQQRFWFLDQLNPVTAFYNLPKAVRLHGVLNLSALARSFAELVRRHETLRTTFRVVDKQPAQVVSPAPAPGLPFFDLSHLEVAGREAEVARLAEEEARLPFDLAAGPLLRPRVLGLAKEEHVLLLTMHHIVSDAWSMAVLIKEVITLYSAYSQGQPSPLPDLPVQYADYAIWQREYLTGELLERQVDYWRKQLKGVAALELPRDRPRRSERSHRAANAGFKLTEDLTQSLRELSERAGATLFMTLLAAFQTLLHRYTNQRDISVGTPIANRNWAEIEGLIGFFVNTLVMRTDFSGDPTFSQLLGRVRETALDAYANQDVPFERLVEELQPERDLSHSPLFQVLFTMQNAPAAKVELAGFEVKAFERQIQFARFDLSLVIEEDDSHEGVGGLLTGSLGLFEPESLHRFVEHYQVLLKSIVADPEQKISQLQILSDTERQKLLVEWNETEREYAAASTLSELFEQQVERTPEAVALVYEAEQVSYRELNERANQLAHYLRQLGVGPEGRVGICVERSVEMVVGLLGILKAGGAYVPLDAQYPEERLRFMLADAQVGVLLTQEQLLGRLPAQTAPVVCLDRDWAAIGQQSRAKMRGAVDVENPAYMIYTSGSTGLPKGVMISHRALVNFLSSMRQQPGVSAHDVWLSVTTLSFDIAALELYLPLMVGAKLVLLRREEASDGNHLARWLRDYGVTVMQATPATWRLLLQARWEGSPGLKLLCGGEALGRELATQLIERSAEAWNLYGPTETTIWSTISKLEKGERDVPIGRPIANTEVYVLDQRGQVVPVGVAGELHIGGAGLARGYWQRAELTAERFIPDSFSGKDGARLYRTGDLVRYLADGELEYLGRVDQQVKVRGHRIELGEIEAVLGQHERVRQSVVIAREDVPGQKQLVAYVVSEGEPEVSSTELRSHLKEQLPEYMVPAFFVTLAELPLTPNGKVDRRALPAPEHTRAQSEESYVAARTPVEELLAAIWCEVLGLEQVGVHDNFFHLGGHSLLATQVISRVRDAFGREVPLRSLFEQPTVAGLAREIEARRELGAELQAPPPLVRVERAERLPLSFAQQRLWFLDQLEPGSAFYNIPAALRLRGTLNIEALERTLSEVVRRHEVLRTHFMAVDGEAVQVIEAAAPIKLEVLDLSAMEKEAGEAEMQRSVSVEAGMPFDLSKGPLLRVSLIRLSAEEHVVLLTMHHIISDGWSMNLLINEVTALYEAYRRGEESPLTELPVQYADYAAWQREWLQGEVLEQQLRYWREQLAGELPVLELPTDFPRPLVQRYQGGAVGFNFSPATTKGLRQLSRRESATMFMTLLGAFDVLLYRCTGQADILTGTPIAGRTRIETEPLIGFFVNTLVLRADLSGNPSFKELMSQVRETALNAHLYQDVPFEKLVEELQPERDLSRSPLFQAMFIFVNAAANRAVELEDLRLSPLGTESGTAKFELTLSVVEGAEQLSGVFEYNSDLFEQISIERMIERWQVLVEGIVADPDQPVEQLPLLSANERRALLDWSNSPVQYPRERCIHDLFVEQAERTPDAVAAIFGEEQLSYRELNARANQVAHYLQAQGISLEQRVGIMIECSPLRLIALLGILKAGGAYLPLDPHYPVSRLSMMLEDAQVSFVITEQHVMNTIPTSQARLLCLDTEWDDIAGYSTSNPHSGASEDSLAYVIYTSGSTGVPKGVLALHGAALNRFQWMWDAYPFVAGELCCQKTSLNFADSVWEIFGPLLRGVPALLIPDQVSKDPLRLGQMLAAHRVTRLVLVPSLLKALLETAEQTSLNLNSLWLWICSGEALPKELYKRFTEQMPGRTLLNLYGSSEVAADATWYETGIDAVREARARTIPIGSVISNLQAYVLDHKLNLLPIGVTGELFIGGVGLARGYLHRPELTAERFIANPYSTEAGARFYRTGDLARWRADGQLEYLGRTDNQVKLRGHRIELGEIEAVLEQHPAIDEAVVVARQEDNDSRLIAYLVAADSVVPTAGELHRYLNEKLPAYMTPAAFVMLDAMPLMPNGKVDRRALPAPESAQLSVGEYLRARTPVEELLAGIWAEILKLERVGVTDNFFELGGHSLLATQVISRVRQTFGVELPVRSLFEMPTVAGLAREIEGGRRVGAELEAPPLVRAERLPLSFAQQRSRSLERVERVERLPLSFAQQRLWFLDQLEPGSTFYNIPAAVRLRGVLNIEALERTLSEVVRRHEVLRTHFIAIDGEPVQVIEAAVPLKLEVLDLSAREEEAREAEMLRLVSIEAGIPFDLSRGPLLRVSLIRLNEKDHVAVVTMHHIVSDGWSMGIFINEVVTLYKAFTEGKESPLEELTIQYADFAHWQRNWLQGEVLAAQLDYWRAELADAPTVIDLPIDKPRPPVQTYRGAYHPLELSTELSAQLRDLSRRHGSTLFMTLLAAFDLLLCRYAGQEQVLVGSPIANRNRSETEALIGFFVNTLVLRGDVRGNPSFRELLRRKRETALNAYAHQDLPFERLVEELQPERDMSRSPLFQVTFTWQNAPSERLELPGLSLSRVGSEGDTAKYELMLLLGEDNGVIAGVMEYNRDLFEAATVERLVASYERVLQAVIADAEQQVLEIELLSEVERQQIVAGWNETKREYSGAVTLPRLFEAQAARRGEAVALVFDGKQLSYAELDRRSNQLAQHLVSLGVSPDSLVAVCLDRSLELFIALLGILKAGAAYLPLDTSYPLARLSLMLADAGSPLLLTTEALADELPVQWTAPLLLDADWDLIALNTDEPLPETVVDADQLAYVMYTSGSTGTPKGVAVTHGGVLRLVTSPNYVRLDADQTLLQLAPLTFDASTLEVWGALLNGGRLVVMPPGAPTLDEISRVIVEEGVTTLWLTAGLFHLMVDEQLEGLSRVDHLLAGGDVLSVHHVEKYLAAISNSNRRLINGYGPTENTTFTCCHVMNGNATLNGSVPIGRPITNTQVYVLDTGMQVVPVGVVGELYIGGAGLARGYFNQPELTAERFVPHPHSTEIGERLYRTGDMVRWHESGELEFVGRVDGQVKIRGFRIEVGEIEAVLAVHSGVREAVVLVREDERGDKRLAAYVVKEAESEVSAGALKEYLREQLPEYMQVQWVVEVEELPLTANGKVDRRALHALEVEIERGQTVQARTPAEEILAAIWAEVLGRETVSVHDNFFELGGHSLLATQVISRVRDAFGQEVALRSLFEQPTVAGLASEIAAGLGAELQAPPLVRVERAERLPLSFAQQRLWFLDQLEPGSSFYNVPAAVRLRGALNVEALERTLSEVVRRHEVLRTHFNSINGEPVQVIEPASPLNLEVLDLSGLDEVERAATTQRLIEEESARPFDLSRGPLLRVSLLGLGAAEHMVLVTMHHIVSDGWSIGVLVREVAALYSAYVRGEESPLEELPVQYADFAHWQRNWLQGEVLDAQLDYWRAELADAPTVIDLPIDKPRPPVQTYRGAYQPLQLSTELSAQLRDLSRRHGSTLFMTLLAAFDLLLCRYAGQEQVLVGSPIANRNRSETEGLIGFFVNTLVLRGDVRGNPSFSELLRRVRETALGAYAHQDLPFEKLVEELQPDRDMSRSPLFQVMFVLQNAPGEALELEGLTLSGMESVGDTAKFELMLGLQEVGETVAGGINYSRDLYEAETIERLVASYERVLQAVVTDAEQRAWEIDLLSDAERRQVIHGWNAPAREYAPALTLSELFEAQAARTPETVALRFEDLVLSYAELNERSNQLAHYLQRSGVGPDVLVGILMHRSVEMIVAVLGILKAGGAYVPLDPSYPRERLAFMVQDAGMRMLLTQEELLNEVPGEYLGQTLSLSEQWAAIAGESTENLASPAQPENVAYVIYTSGSTGQPKGVLISHENVVRLLEATQPHFKFNQNDVWTLFHSYAFDFSVWEIWGALAYGGKLVIVPYWVSRSAEAFHALLVSEQVTVLNQTPSAFRQLMAADESVGAEDELKLRLVIFGGEALELQSLRPWFTRHGDRTPRLVNMFGITETTVHVTYRPLTAADLELASSSVIGRPLECLQVYLLDGYGQPVPIGVPGEICVGGTGLARGYLNRAELTAERFLPHPFSTSPGARLYKSGDLARFLPNGDIEYLGRIDQQVKVRGFRIELGEIEAALAEHEAVRDCTVVASADANGETKLLAYLVAGRQQAAPSVTALREFLKEKLPEYMIPASFTMLDAMPLTPNGKIDRKALPTPDQGRSTLFGDYVPPRSAVEQILARIWAELLQVERVGLNDNFFDLGGHSLLATRLVARLRSVLSMELPLRAVFESPTLVGLSETVLQQPGQRARIEKTAEVLLELEQLSEGEAGQMLEEVIVSTSERAAR